jgi:hypothetical protein
MPINFLSIINSYADFAGSCQTTSQKLAKAYPLERTQPRVISVPQPPTYGALPTTNSHRTELRVWGTEIMIIIISLEKET